MASQYDYTKDQLPNFRLKNGNLGDTTSNTGNLVTENNASLTVGRAGGILLEDHQLQENLRHFVRERIPERVVHAKGSSAAGTFTCTGDITRLTCATVFSAIGKQTPIRARFSTVAGNLGSADTVRDPRGFAIKFYTEDGIWDLVGNNTPIFFIRDPILFAPFIHSQKRNPETNCPDPNSFWDFISLRPETVHQVLILMSDRGIPNGHRHMHGYGSHTFALLNCDGVKTYVKFHFKTQQGIQNLSAKDAERLAGSAPDYSQKDLYNAIESQNFPKWTMYIQTMTEKQAAASSFDPFDVTKVWPQGDYPLQEVGTLELNKNPENYFAEVEQLSFSPASFIEGIGPSQDRMLLGRIFSYSDAHLHRLGPNFAQLPVNAPYRVQNFQRDGANNINNQGGTPNYHPNSFGGPDNHVAGEKLYPTSRQSGTARRYDIGNNDNYTQARVFYKTTIEEPERQRIADNIVSSLKKAVKEIRKRTVDMFNNVDEDLARKITSGLRAANLNVAL